jgi:hypothetical protein
MLLYGRDGRNTLVTQAKSGPALWSHDTYSSTVDLVYPFISDLTSGGPTDGALRTADG